MIHSRLLLVAFVCIYAETTPPTFRIVAPQTICEKASNNQSADEGPQGITVSMQPRDGIKLHYRVQIFFKTIGNGSSRGQRKTLQIWKAVRDLEQRLNVNSRDTIADSNILAIDKGEVVSGVVYIFHITGTTEAGESSKEEYFTIKYKDGNLERSDASEGLNFLLLGSEMTVANIPYLLTAKVTFCVPRFDYYIHWKVQNLDEEHQEYTHTTGSTLKIPPNALLPGSEYRIEASVLQANDSAKIAQDYVTVQVTKRGFDIFIFPTHIKVGVNKPVLFQVFLNDFDNDGEEIQISWECTSTYEGLCADGESLNETKYDVSFARNGNYQISASVTYGAIKKYANAEVVVDSSIYSSFEFSHIPALLTVAGSAVHMNVLISNLIPKCAAGWLSVQEDGFEYIDSTGIESAFEHFEIKDWDENFLSELADFGNSTVNRDLSLNIPTPTDMWSGLKGDEKYKFRLYTICPPPYVENGRNDVNDTDRKVSSSLEFIVYTNAAPVEMPLEVKPLTGIALRTTFQLSTGNAKDLFLNSPLSYEFSIKVDGIVLKLAKFYEHKEFDTQLPYSTSPVQVMYTVCDIQLACNTVSGDQVQVSYETLSKEDMQLKERQIKENFNRMDFLEGQNLILMCALTYKNSNDNEVYENFKAFAVQLLLREIDKLYEMPSEKFYVPKEDIVVFINQTHLNLEVLDVKSTEILEKLLDLLEATASEELQVGASDFRRKREVLPEGRSIVDADYVRVNLKVLEKLIESHNESSLRTEKPRIATRIAGLALKMCKSDKITKHSVVTNIASIDVQKMTGNQMFGKKFPIPSYFTQTEGSFTVNIHETKSRVKHFCVALVELPDDYFTGDSNPIFNIQILDLGSSVVLDGFSSVVLTLPKRRLEASRCLSLDNQSWSSNMCTTRSNWADSTSCTCDRLGYYKLSKHPPSEATQSTHFPTYSTVRIKPTVSSFVSSAPPRSPTVTTHYFTNETTSFVFATLVISSTERSIVLNNDDPAEDVSKASPIINYLIPILCLLSILIIILSIILYRRRVSVKKKIPAVVIEPRVSKPGIKYAKFHDEHLMTGNFSFDAN